MKFLAWRVSLLIAFGAVLAAQQAPPPPPMPPPLSGAQATDPKRVVFEMEDALGMLRGLQQRDSVNRLEYWGTSGAVAVQGQMVPISKFRVSINYAVPGLRMDIARGRDRDIRVVADRYAWNEETPGGRATPAPSSTAERLLQIWLTPVGLAKAAAASPQTIVSVESGVTTLSFDVAGARVKTWLNALYEPERVEARVGTNVIGIVYANYGDWNDNAKADVYLPRRITQTLNGAPALDLTIEHTNTYNPYVIMPVPENVLRAAR